MDAFKEFFGWVEFDWEMFMMSGEFYLVVAFTTIIALAITGSFFIKDVNEDDV